MTNSNLVFLKPKGIAIVKCAGCYQDVVPAAWSKLFQWLERAGHRRARGLGYEFAFDATQNISEFEKRYAVAVRIPASWQKIDDSLIAQEKFEGGAFKAFRIIGPYNALFDKRADLISSWDGRDRLVLDIRRPVLTLYYSDPRQQPCDEHISDICVPVFAERRAEPRS